MSETAIAADMGGSHVDFGMVREDRVIACETFTVSEPALRVVLPELEVRIPALAAKCGIELRELAGIALGICAIVDGGSKVPAANGKYDDGIGFDLSRWSESTFGLRCRVENDTRLAQLVEYFAGEAKGFEDAALITLGTGIGGAVMLGGELLVSGGHKAGGSAGHLGVVWNGRPCSCGNRACAEAEAWTASLDSICREQDRFAKSVLASSTQPIDFCSLFAAVEQGDGLARDMLDRCIGIWSALTVSLIHAYDPRVIIFGGGVMKRHEAILPQIREHVDRHAWAEKGSVKIVPTALGSSTALLEALPLLRGRA